MASIRLCDCSRETVAEVLLSDGFLIPTMDCLKMLNIKYEGECFGNHITWVKSA